MTINATNAITVLITGGAGFIGSNFIRYLCRERPNWQLVSLDIQNIDTDQHRLAGLAKTAQLQQIQGDIADNAMLERLFRQYDFDVVLNFAAQTQLKNNDSNPAPFWHTNVLGTQTLLESSRQADIVRFVQISTDQVYGPVSADSYVNEKAPLNPSTPYSASKAAADLMVQAYMKTYDFPAVITRCSNNYGPYQAPDKLIARFITGLLDNQKIPIYGDGLHVRDWLHVDDHCAALLAVIEKANNHQLYNIGGNNDRANLEVLRMILDYLGKDVNCIDFVADPPGHERRYAVDCTQIERELRWEPKIDFAEGLTQTIEWYLANESWWRPFRTPPSKKLKHPHYV